jgi:hypothetical protein
MTTFFLPSHQPILSARVKPIERHYARPGRSRAAVADETIDRPQTAELAPFRYVRFFD